MAGADGVAARAEKKSAQKSSDKITGAGETGFMPDIIIVEDNREIGTLLCDFLRKENYTVSLADTGEKALDIFERYGANLLVLDIGLPGVDGFSVCAKIREILETLRKNPPAEIAGYKVLKARDYKADTIQDMQTGEVSSTGLPTSNVLYYDLSDDAWLCVRPSGTEPKVKFYYGIKGTSLSDADEKSAAMGREVLAMIDKIM